MIEWDDKYCVGILRIDNDHKRYIDTLNKLILLKKNNETSEGIKQVLREMTNYVLIHFKTEETYMSEFNYPDYQNHKNEHHDFAMKIISYLDKVVNGEYQIARDMLEDLKSWLVSHIQSTDLKYIDCFIKNGLK